MYYFQEVVLLESRVKKQELSLYLVRHVVFKEGDWYHHRSPPHTAWHRRTTFKLFSCYLGVVKKFYPRSTNCIYCMYCSMKTTTTTVLSSVSKSIKLSFSTFFFIKTVLENYPPSCSMFYYVVLKSVEVALTTKYPLLMYNGPTDGRTNRSTIYTPIYPFQKLFVCVLRGGGMLMVLNFNK